MNYAGTPFLSLVVHFQSCPPLKGHTQWKLYKLDQTLQYQETFLIITIPRNLIKLLVICLMSNVGNTNFGKGVSMGHVTSCGTKLCWCWCPQHYYWFIFKCSKHVMSCRVNPLINLISFSCFNTVLVVQPKKKTVLVGIWIKLDTALSPLSNGKGLLYMCVLIVYSQVHH